MKKYVCGGWGGGGGEGGGEDLLRNNLNYYLVKGPKFARFYMLPKIHKGLYDVAGRPVILNCIILKTYPHF